MFLRGGGRGRGEKSEEATTMMSRTRSSRLCQRKILGYKMSIHWSNKNHPTSTDEGRSVTKEGRVVDAGLCLFLKIRSCLERRFIVAAKAHYRATRITTLEK